MKKIRLYFIACTSIIRWSVVYASSWVDQTILMHLLLMRDVPVTMGDVTYGFHEVEWLLQTNIGAMLVQSSNPEKSFSDHMNQIQQAIHQQRYNIQSLQVRHDREVQKQKICIGKKRTTDREFFQWVERRISDESLESISSDSATAGACAEKARVKARAYRIMMKKSATYRRALEKRFALLRANETFILQNTHLINTSPKTIIQVNKLIKQLH